MSQATPWIEEPARQTLVVEQVDVVVAGGGPAGVAAALVAARNGASVRLLELHGQLGGIWTTGLLAWVLDANNKHGIMREIINRLNQRSAVIGGKKTAGPNGMPYDPEQMKLVLEQMCQEAGVRVRLHTRVVGALIDAEHRITAVMTESKSGRQAYAAKMFIDCTGDGDLAALAGCEFDFGRPAQGLGAAGADRVGETQPMSMICMVTGIDEEATAAFHRRTDSGSVHPKDALRHEFQKSGLTPSYAKPTIFVIAPDLYAWMINHEYHASGLNADDLTRATIHARQEIHQLIDALRQQGGIWSGLRIVATAGQIGVREGRRIRGLYTVCMDDMLAGRRFDDAICRATFGIDVHSTNPSVNKAVDHSDKQKIQPYDIPYRAIIAKDVRNLLMAGRCISGDFLSHSSYRVTGNAVAMGEAAGVAAAVASLTGRCPADLQFASDIRPLLQPLRTPID